MRTPFLIPLRECRTEANLEKENDHHGFFRYENNRRVGQRYFAAQPGKVSHARKIGTPPRLVILRLIHNVQGGERDRGETPQSQAERKAFRSHQTCQSLGKTGRDPGGKRARGLPSSRSENCVYRLTDRAILA